MDDFGIVFDCDGTLLDTIGVWRDAERTLFEMAGAQPTKEYSDMLVTFTLPETGRFFHETLGLGSSAADVLRLLDDILLDFYATKAVPREGALSFVRALAERGVPMTVASSSPQAYLRAGLDATGFSPYLAAIVSVDDAGASKREPAVYDLAREACGTSRAATWGFEDSLYAIRTLSRAGFRTVGVYDRDDSGTFDDLFREADIAVRSFLDLSAETFPARPSASADCMLNPRFA